MVIDNADAFSASRVASGIINPVTGRRVVTTWKIDELLPFAESTYKLLEDELHCSIIQQKDIVAFPSAPDMVQAYQKRIDEGNSFIHSNSNREELSNYFNIPFNIINIHPCYLIHVQQLLVSFRQLLIKKNSFLQEDFNEDELLIEHNFIQYKNIQANAIIYCNGMNAFNSRFWKQLPFVANKGEALIASIRGLPVTDMYKFSQLSIVPWKDDLWWIGSSNDLNFTDAQPTELFKQKTTAAIQAILKVPFAITDHIAGIRPATVERRPFVGAHPLHKNVFILNGMGSKGCSIAPWAAQQVTAFLLSGKNPDKEIDMLRFEKVLLR